MDTLAALHRLEGITRIDLVGLDDAGVVALMEAGAGHRLDDAALGLASAIYRETDGNPFFVSEVLRNLIETGAIGQDADGRWVAESTLDAVALPDSVRDVIGARVLRLGKEAGRILSMAAVIGRDFDLHLLAVATNSTEDDVLDVLEAAAAVPSCGSRRTPRDDSTSPTPSSSTPSTRTSDRPAGRGPTGGRRGTRGTLRTSTRSTRVGELARHWIAAATRRPDQGHRLLPPGGRRRAQRPRPCRRASLLHPSS